MRSSARRVRTTIYLAGPAVEALDRVKNAYQGRYGIEMTVSAVFARLLLGESIDEVIERPYRAELARIAGERNKRRDELQRAHTKRRTKDLHRIHRAIADLFPRIKQILHTLDRAKRRNEAHSPDFAEAAQLEHSLNELMSKCVDAIVPGRRH
jgi:hypothetical protein